LENYFQDAYDNAVATARTCYSSKVINAGDVSKDDQTRNRRDAIAKSIYKAGHHTTLQHATFQFVLDKVSRQFIWSFLHSHPFYNSEQVSQRYVEVKPEHFTVPPLEEKAEALYRETIRYQMAAYHKLLDILQPTTKAEYQKIFPNRDVEEKKWANAIKKKELEVARYVLPVATHAHLYHTISGITLHRYHRLCEQFDTPFESRFVVLKMIEAVSEVDPDFFKFIEDVIPLEETLEYQLFQESAKEKGGKQIFLEEFDAGLEGRTSKLIDYKVNGEKTMAQAVRSILGLPAGQLSDEEAIEVVMNPQKDPYLAQALTLTTLGKLTRTMVHPHFTFKKKLSHTADSQDQRHRMTPGSRPVLASQIDPGKPDYVVPVLIQKNEKAWTFYREVMETVWKAIASLREMGVSEEFTLYLLPNGTSIRFEESGDLLNFHHKWVQRLCYTAQEEIWKSCYEEVVQVREVFPHIGKYLGAPCWTRKEAGKQPFCPEGDRYCGVPVWKLDLRKYDRVI